MQKPRPQSKTDQSRKSLPTLCERHLERDVTVICWNKKADFVHSASLSVIAHSGVTYFADLAVLYVESHWVCTSWVCKAKSASLAVAQYSASHSAHFAAVVYSGTVVNPFKMVLLTLLGLTALFLREKKEVKNTHSGQDEKEDQSDAVPASSTDGKWNKCSC